MKKLCFALLTLFAVTAVASAPVNADVNFAYSFQQEEKTPVKADELPEAVKTALAATDYKGWEIAEAFLVKKSDAEYYEISLKSADKTTTVKLDKEGKKID